MTRFRLAASFAAVAVVALAAVLSAFVGCASSSSTANPGFGGYSGGSGGQSGQDAGGVAGQNGTGSGGATAGGSGGFSGHVDGGSDAGAGVGGSTGAGGTSAGCRVNVTPLSPPPPNVVEDGPNATVRVQASLTGFFSSTGVGGAGGSQGAWQWTVTYGLSVAPPQTPITPSAVDDRNATMDFPVVSAGFYTVTARFTGAPSCTPGTVSVMVKDPGPMWYHLRATAANYPVQDTTYTIGDPQPRDLLLDKGTVTNFSTRTADPNSVPLVSYVRITDRKSGVSVDGDTSLGALRVPLIVDVNTQYDVMVFPPDPYAPQQLSWPAGTLQSLLVLNQGIPINATTADSNGKPVDGARMVLRSGSLESTLGKSISGVAKFWVSPPTTATPTTMAMDIVPPVGSGLPSAAVGEGSNPATDPGIPIGSDTAYLSLSMKWDDVTTGALTIHVLAPGNVATGAGARVRATAKAAPGPVGTLIVQPAGISLRPTGTTDVEVVTDAAGTAVFGALPIGDYTVMVIPAPSDSSITASSLAITSTTLTLAAAGLETGVVLSTKATLTGTMKPPLPGTLVTAIDHSVTASGAVVSTTVGTDGISYQLFVDPGRSYELLAQPPTASGRGRAVLARSISSATPTIPAVTLPIAHAVSGRVLDSGGTSALPNTLVQAFCDPSSPRCLDATFPLAETVAGPNGAYTLMLPDPPTN